MNIRSKLSLTFTLLLIFGVTAVSSYSILFIRDYLLEKGKEQMAKDASYLSVALEFSPIQTIDTILNQFNQVSGYDLTLLQGEDSTIFVNGKVKPTIIVSYLADDFSVPVYFDSDSKKLFTYVHTGGLISGHLVRMSQDQHVIYEPVRTIRYIIYTGMFISIFLIVLVSQLIAKSISKPILQLKKSAQRIADGDTTKGLYVSRNDEFGELADSLTKMAFKLREDTGQIQQMYNRHRQFYTDITHEVRNPLHIIKGSLEMILLSNSDQTAIKNHLQTAQRQVDRLNHLFNDMLLIQKYDDKEYSIVLEPVELDSLYSRIFEHYRAEAESRGITLNAQVSGLSVMADAEKLEQVLENLVKNAIKYSNGTNINLVAKRTAHEVMISVTDNGIGIEKQYHDKIFDRFFRADKARSRQEGGSGLGLAIVKSILKQHETDIHIESEPGKGSTFYFSLETA